jgi:hypothetical protein
MKRILLILIFLPALCFGQQKTYIGTNNEYNTRHGGFQAVKMLRVPRSFSAWSGIDSLGMVWVDSANGGTLYYHNGLQRISVGSGGGSGITSITFQSPLTGGTITSNGTVSIPAATGSTSGYLTSADWTTFNSKQAALGYTPEDVSNKATTFSIINNFLYPTTSAVNTLVNSTVSVYARLDTLPYYIRVEDSLYGTPFAYMPYYQAYSRFVPYVNPISDINWTSRKLTVRTNKVDTIEAKEFETGIHFHHTFGGELDIVTMGWHGTQFVYLHGYPTAVPGDSVLTTNDSGRIIRFNLKSKLFQYILKDDTGAYVATKAWVNNAISGFQPAGNYITALTGDVTAAGPGSAAATLANSGVTAGTYGSATAIPGYTVDAKGRITGVTTYAPTPAVGNITGLGTGVATFLSTPSSANLRGAITDETGSGVAVFNDKPQFLGTRHTITVMAAQAVDGSLGNVFTRTLAASETFTQSNISAGQTIIVIVRQGSGTSYGVTWWSGITWETVGGAAPTQTTTSNGYTTYGFLCTGTNTFIGYLVGTN